MTRLTKTDVWYKTLRLQRGSRFSYALSPNDSPEDRHWTEHLDPLNPRVYPEDPTYRFGRASILDTPGAPDERWARQTPPQRGRIEARKFKSALLKNERDIWIYTPPGYTAVAGPYPFVLLFDGGTYVSSRWLDAPRTVDNLIADGRIRAPIVCFIPAVNRGAEQGFPGGEAYGDAIVRELLPMLRSSYAITSTPRDMVIGGYSSGGFAAALIALRHSDAFGNVLSQSGSFRGRRPNSLEPNSLAQDYRSAQRLPIRFYLETGRYDNVPSAGLPLHEMVLDETNTMGNRHFRDVLMAKGYDVTYREVGAQHENVHWRAMLADGLMMLLPPADARPVVK
jgi:enterochelin esterase family protein